MKPDVCTEQASNSRKAHPGETLRKKISKSVTQNTRNRHLSYRDHPTPDPAAAGAETRACLPERHPYPSADPARRPHPATYPLAESRGRFVDDPGRRATLPQLLPEPLLRPQLWQPRIQPMHGCRLATSHVYRGHPPQKPLRHGCPHTLWSPTDAAINQTGVTYHAYHAYHAPFPSAARLMVKYSATAGISMDDNHERRSRGTLAPTSYELSRDVFSRIIRECVVPVVATDDTLQPYAHRVNPLMHSLTQLRLGGVQLFTHTLRPHEPPALPTAKPGIDG